MISSKTLRNAAAAGLVTLVGTGPAYAAIEISSTGTVSNAVVVATETITTSAERGTGAEKNFSLVSTDTAASLLAIETTLGLNALAGDTVTVEYTFSGGMQLGFNGVVTADILTFQADGSTAVTGGTRTVRRGGSEGDSHVTVTITGVALPATSKVRLVIEYLAFLSSGGADQSGGVTVVTSLSGTPILSNTVTGEGIVRLVTGINDKVTSQNQTASSTANFLEFVGGSATVTNENKTARFGQIDLGIASVSGATPGSTLALRNRGTGVISDTAAGRKALSSARVGFSGALTFVDKAYLSTATCPNAGSFNLLDEDGAWKTGTARANIDQAYNMYLCIEVDGETPITATEYMATIDNTKITDAVFEVSDSDGLSLGEIMLDGTSVHIPFISTHSGYNHRVLLTNNGAQSVPYTVTFPEGASPRSRATGVVPANTTITIPVSEMVEVSEGSRTSATVTAVGVIDVATVLVNRGDGSTDTVLYQ